MLSSSARIRTAAWRGNGGEGLPLKRVENRSGRKRAHGSAGVLVAAPGPSTLVCSEGRDHEHGRGIGPRPAEEGVDQQLGEQRDREVGADLVLFCFGSPGGGSSFAPTLRLARSSMGLVRAVTPRHGRSWCAQRADSATGWPMPARSSSSRRRRPRSWRTARPAQRRGLRPAFAVRRGCRASAPTPSSARPVANESLGCLDSPQYLTPSRFGSTERGWRRKITRCGWLCVLLDRSAERPAGLWGRVHPAGRRGGPASYVGVPRAPLLAGPQATALGCPVALERSSASKL